MLFQAVVPTLRVDDFAASRRFYEAGLGFAVDWEWRDAPGEPAFVQMSRDGMNLYLSERAGDAAPGGLVYLYVANVDHFHDDLRARGVVADEPPGDRPWGNREMRLRDPDGNTLCIATPLALLRREESRPQEA